MKEIIYTSEKPLGNSINIVILQYLTNIMPVLSLLIDWHYRLKQLIGCQTPLHKLSRRPSENLVPPVAANLLLD